MRLSERQGKPLCYFDLKDNVLIGAMISRVLLHSIVHVLGGLVSIHWTEEALLITRHEF